MLPQGREPNSPQCSFNGVYQCGVCKCNDEYFGKKCECGKDTPLGSGTTDESNCRETNTSKICNGQGTCSCGECKCNARENPAEVINLFSSINYYRIFLTYLIFPTKKYLLICLLLFVFFYN